MSGKWFDTGAEATEKALAGGDWSDIRFKMKAGDAAVIAFTHGNSMRDEPPGHYKEHEYVVRGRSYPARGSCVGASRCWICEQGVGAYDAWAFTVIQIAPVYEDRDGKKYPNARRLYIAKKKAFIKLQAYMEKRDGLVGSIWDVMRTTKDSWTIGDDMQYKDKPGGKGDSLDQRRAALAKSLGAEPEDMRALDYEKLLAPKDRDMLEQEGIDIEATLRRQEEGMRGGQRGGRGSGDRDRGRDDRDRGRDDRDRGRGDHDDRSRDRDRGDDRGSGGYAERRGGDDRDRGDDKDRGRDDKDRGRDDKDRGRDDRDSGRSDDRDRGPRKEVPYKD